MPTGLREAAADLTRAIYETGYHFDFFQLAHLLERWKAAGAPIGHSGPYRAERVRFRPDSTLRFSPGDVRRVEPDDHDPAVDVVVVNFMGLYGVAAPTPVYLTELIGFSDVDAEPLADFLDLFNHRLISLYYRAWTKYRFPYRYQPGARDQISGIILSFIGLGDPAVRSLTDLPVWRLMRYVGLLAGSTRPPVSLRLLLADFFQLDRVAIQEFVLRTVAVPAHQLNRIGVANSRLGVDLVVGRRVSDRSGKFRVSLGPLSWADYCAFLPETERCNRLAEVVRLWLNDRLEHDLELVLDRRDIPPLELSAERAPRLGWTSWLRSPELEPASDARIVFPPRSAA